MELCKLNHITVFQYFPAADGPVTLKFGVGFCCGCCCGWGGEGGCLDNKKSMLGL